VHHDLLSSILSELAATTFGVDDRHFEFRWSAVTLPTLPDVAWLPEFKKTTTTSGFGGRHLECRQYKTNVGQSSTIVA
jgi:hypothetical protein